MILKRNKLFGYLFIIMLISGLQVTVAYAGTNGQTQAQAVAWANSQVGQTLEYPDSGLENPCFDLICYYYQELGQEIPWVNADQDGSGAHGPSQGLPVFAETVFSSQFARITACDVRNRF